MHECHLMAAKMGEAVCPRFNRDAISILDLTGVCRIAKSGDDFCNVCMFSSFSPVNRESRRMNRHLRNKGVVGSRKKRRTGRRADHNPQRRTQFRRR